MVTLGGAITVGSKAGVGSIVNGANSAKVNSKVLAVHGSEAMFNTIKMGTLVATTNVKINGKAIGVDGDKISNGTVVTAAQNRMRLHQGLTWIPIRTYDELISIGKIAAFPINGNYYLANNIDCGGRFPQVATDRTKPFTGVFDGRGNTISNLYFDGRNMSDSDLYYVGIFNATKGAVIKDLRIYNVNFLTAEVATRGAILVGECLSTTLSNISIELTTTSTTQVAGFVASVASQCVANNIIVKAPVRDYWAMGAGAPVFSYVTGGTFHRIAGYGAVSSIVETSRNMITLTECALLTYLHTGYLAAYVSNNLTIRNSTIQRIISEMLEGDPWVLSLAACNTIYEYSTVILENVVIGGTAQRRVDAFSDVKPYIDRKPNSSVDMSGVYCDSFNANAVPVDFSKDIPGATYFTNADTPFTTASYTRLNFSNMWAMGSGRTYPFPMWLRGMGLSVVTGAMDRIIFNILANQPNTVFYNSAIGKTSNITACRLNGVQDPSLYETNLNDGRVYSGPLKDPEVTPEFLDTFARRVVGMTNITGQYEIGVTTWMGGDWKVYWGVIREYNATI